MLLFAYVVAGPKGFCFVTRLIGFLFCSSLRFVVCMCLCLFLLEQALFRYEIGFYFVPRYVFVCSLHRPLFAFISAGLAQKDFVLRCVLVGCLHIL